MLWELLVAIGSVMFVVSAVQSARHANTGPGGFALVVAVGLIFAVVYELAAHKFADALDDRKNRWSESAQRWCLRGLYLGPVLFLPFAALLGEYVTLNLLRLR
jgi:hypothetical protein